MEILLLHFVAAFCATASFSLLFNAPLNTFVAAGLTGGAGWVTFVALRDFVLLSSINANLLASIVIAFLGEIYARREKKPVTIYVVPGIVVLVPGYSIYKAMNLFLNDYSSEGMTILLRARMESGAIAVGILVVGVIARITKQQRARLTVKLTQVHRKIK